MGKIIAIEDASITGNITLVQNMRGISSNCETLMILDYPSKSQTNASHLNRHLVSRHPREVA